MHEINGTNIYSSNLAAGFAVEQCSQSIQVMVKEVTKALKEPHKFSAFHKAIRSPFDYYAVSTIPVL